MTVQENHYSPWGLNLAGIEKEGSPDHKFQYNGKEKQEELGLDWVDYGWRNYDPQLGRWHGADPSADKFESFSPYSYAFNNGLSVIDPDGRENIVVVGGIDQSGGDPYKFLTTGLKQYRAYRKYQSGEKTTMALFTAHASSDDIGAFSQRVFDELKDGESVSMVTLDSDADLVNYINSGLTESSELSDKRSNDQITDMSFFGHGLQSRGGFDPGYPAQLNSGLQQKYNFGIDDVWSLNQKAFAKNSIIGLYSCNAATEGGLYAGTNFARELSLKTGGYVFGWQGQTTYN